MLQNKRGARVSSTGALHQTTLEHTNELDGTKRCWKSGSASSALHSSNSVATARDPVSSHHDSLETSMAPGKKIAVVDLTAENEDDDQIPPLSRPVAPRQHVAGRRPIKETIDILSSPEPHSSTPSHDKSRNLLNGKVKTSTNYGASRSRHVSAISSLPRATLPSKSSLQGRASDADRQRQFGDRKHSAILDREANRSGPSKENRVTNSSPQRTEAMTGNGAFSVPNSLPKRPRDSDRSSDGGSFVKRPRLNTKAVRSASRNAAGIISRDLQLGPEVIDLTQVESEPKSPEVLISRKAARSERIAAPRSLNLIFAAANPRHDSRTDERPLAGAAVINGLQSTLVRKSVSGQSKNGLWLPKDIGGSISGTQTHYKEPTPRRSRASEVPESEPGSPDVVDKEIAKYKPAGLSRSSTPKSPAALKLDKAFSRAAPTRARSDSFSSLSSRSVRSTPDEHSSLAASANTNGRRLDRGQRTLTATKESLLLRDVYGDLTAPTSAENDDPRVDNPRRQAFPLSPSPTSTEDSAHRDRGPTKKDIAKFGRQTPVHKTQKTSEKANNSPMLEIPESASRSRPPNKKKPGPLTILSASPLHKQAHLDAATSTSSAHPFESQTTSITAQDRAIKPCDDSKTAGPGVSETGRPRDMTREENVPPSSRATSLRNAEPGSQTTVFWTSSKAPISTDLKLTPDSLSLSASRQIECIVGSYVEELHADNEFWNHSMLKKARQAVNDSDSGHSKTTDVFSKLKPLPLISTGATDAMKSFSFEVLGKKTRTHWIVPSSGYDTAGNEVPPYSQYVSIKNNFLAHNDITLQHYPYFGDDFDMADAEGLSLQYYLDIDKREQKLKSLAMAESLAGYAEDMLMEADCQWSDVLYFLLAPTPDVGSDPDAKAALHRRDQDNFTEDLARLARRWKTVLSGIRDRDAEQVGRAAILCDHFQKLTKLPLWHVARMSHVMRELLQENSKDSPPESESARNDDLTCRVCMRFNCPYHGEVYEPEEDDYTITDAEDQIARTDIINPPEVNQRTRIGFPPSVSNDDLGISKSKHTLNYWRTGNGEKYTFKPDERKPFYPCHHPGQSCNTAQCSCFELRLPCEKSCGCSVSCVRKFQGCNCTRKGKKVCFENDECVCFQLGRECDPDLCGECGVCDVLNPCNRDDDQILRGNCRNANIQRGVHKHTMIGDSGIHGLGLYACEEILEHDFVGEYKGEIVTKEEAERRGAVYEHQKLSYLFSLNQSQEIDSTHFGNKIRFINHAVKGKFNLYPRIQLVNTVHRIALYALRKIRPGEELFFDYGPQFPSEQLGGKTGKKSAQQGQSKAAPHVRNSNLVRDFWDITTTLDVSGNAVPARKGGKLWSTKYDLPPKGARAAGSRANKPSTADERADVRLHDANDSDDNEDEGEPDYQYDIGRYKVIDVTEGEESSPEGQAHESSSDAYESEEEVPRQRRPRGRSRRRDRASEQR